MYESRFKSEEMDALMEAVLSLQNIEECYRFFDDLCTVKELEALRQRYTVAKMLENGEIFLKITEVTGASAATISRVNRCLKYGADGYKIALDRTDKKNK